MAAFLLHANGAIAVTSYHSSAPLSNSVTYTVPANTLAGGQSYTTAIAFDAIVSTNAALAGSYNCAYYDKVTIFQVVALPHVGVISTSGGTLQLGFSGILQESSDLKTWTDVSPQPPSPWSVPVERLSRNVLSRPQWQLMQIAGGLQKVPCCARFQPALKAHLPPPRSLVTIWRETGRFLNLGKCFSAPAPAEDENFPGRIPRLRGERGWDGRRSCRSGRREAESETGPSSSGKFSKAG